MSNNLNTELWLVGAGTMALDYVKVLKAQNVNFKVIGRGEDSASILREKTGAGVITGGLENALKSLPAPGYAIVATGIEQLAATTALLMNAGVKNILVEKPGGFYEDLEKLAVLATTTNSNVLIAYNRRFYAAALKAQEIIQEDGGVKSFHFEFTEWAHTIEPLQKGEGVKEQWLLGNSTHVIDLAFFMGGFPGTLTSHVAGSLSWHPSASIFAGSGISDKGALFSYQANWAAPGRWSVEMITNKHRLIFRPMEKLQIQKIGSVAIEEVSVDYALDTEFKPGLYLQIKSFIQGDNAVLPTIQKQLINIGYYKKINFGS